MLHVEMVRTGSSTNLWKVEGLTEKELDELNSMEYRDMKDKILDIVSSRKHDYREKDIATAWACGYGVYNAYIMNGAVYIETGKSCD